LYDTNVFLSDIKIIHHCSEDIKNYELTLRNWRLCTKKE